MKKRRLSEPSFAFLLNAPALLAIVGLVGYPIAYSLWLSLHRYNLERPNLFRFIGVQNYVEIFASDEFWAALQVTLVFTGLAVLLVVALAIAVALLAGVVAPHDPEAINPIEGEKPPAFAKGGSWTYPLGTDRKGRDILSRVILGTLVSLAVAACAILPNRSGSTAGCITNFMGTFSPAWVAPLHVRRDSNNCSLAVKSPSGEVAQNNSLWVLHEVSGSAAKTRILRFGAVLQDVCTSRRARANVRRQLQASGDAHQAAQAESPAGARTLGERNS